MAGVKKKDRIPDAGRRAYELRQLLDPSGQPTSWDQVGRELGYPPGPNRQRVALAAARRWERAQAQGKTKSRTRWNDSLPWDVAHRDVLSSEYRLIVAHLKDLAGEALEPDELGRLEQFRAYLAGPYPEAPWGLVIAYAGENSGWFVRPRTAVDEDIYVPK